MAERGVLTNTESRAMNNCCLSAGWSAWPMHMGSAGRKIVERVARLEYEWDRKLASKTGLHLETEIYAGSLSDDVTEGGIMPDLRVLTTLLVT